MWYLVIFRKMQLKIIEALLHLNEVVLKISSASWMNDGHVDACVISNEFIRLWKKESWVFVRNRLACRCKVGLPLRTMFCILWAILYPGFDIEVVPPLRLNNRCFSMCHTLYFRHLKVTLTWFSSSQVNKLRTSKCDVPWKWVKRWMWSMVAKDDSMMYHQSQLWILVHPTRFERR